MLFWAEFMKLIELCREMTVESKSKLEICMSCDELTSNFKCNVCGCLMKIKVNIPFAKCPLSKW